MNQETPDDGNDGLSSGDPLGAGAGGPEQPATPPAIPPAGSPPPPPPVAPPVQQTGIPGDPPPLGAVQPAPGFQGQGGQVKQPGVAVAGFVLGIVGTFFGITLCFWFLGLILGAVAIPLSVVGKRQAREVGASTGISTAGLVLGIIAAVIGVIILIVVLIAGFNANWTSNN